MHKLAPTYAIVLTLLVPTAAIATHSNAHNSTHRQVSVQPRYTPPPFPASSTPTGRARGAAGRGGCGFKLPLTALAPAIEKSVGTGKATYVWGQTIAKYPTFWFYIPAASPALRSIEFVLQDERDNDVYRSAVELPAKPGIIGVRLPSTQTPLELNRNYHWFLKTEIAARCDRQNSAIVVKDSVEGWIQRVSPSATVAQPLETTTPQQQLALYAREGLWYDAISTIAEQRLLQPENTALKANWNELLHSANLSDMTSQPLLP